MWAGGKSKMLEKYEPYLPKTFKGYCEPFLGGGAMFIWAYKGGARDKGGRDRHNHGSWLNVCKLVG